MPHDCCAAVDLFTAGSAAAESILRDVYHVDIAKALDPLHPGDYAKIVQKLALTLKGHAVPVEAQAVKQAIEALDVDWVNLSKEQRWKILDAAKAHLGAPVAQAVLPKIEQTLAFHAKDIVTSTKAKTVLKYDLGISPSFSETDARIAKLVTASQGHYVRDAFGKRQDAFGVLAKQVVASGLEKGLGSADIASDLHSALGEQAGRGQGYWNMLAMVFANRARTMTQVFSYGEAGIEYYLWDSVLDEVTSMQCRFLHGRRFAVAGAMNSVNAVEDADSPEDIRTIQPFMQLSGSQLYYGTGEDKKPVATVTQNVVGQKDKIGSFADALHTDALEAAGIRMPPVHGHCRSTVIPDVSAPVAGPKPVPAAPAATAPKPTPGEAKGAALAALDASSQDGLMHLADHFTTLEDAGFSDPPYMDHFDPDTFYDVVDANAVSKKPKLADLIPTQSTADEEKIRAFIKTPKKLDDAVAKVVKFQDKLFIVDGHEAIAAQKLLGQKVAYVQYTDLDKALKAPKPPAPVVVPTVVHPPTPAPHAQATPPPPVHTPAVAPALAPAAPPSRANVVLGTKLAGPGGSNPGGVYKGTDGVERYVKFYTDASQAPGEHLANNLYRDLGHGAPKSTIFEHEGKTAYASEMMQGVRTLGDVGLTRERAREAMKGFVADVLTGNWDAAGMSLDNMVVTTDGQVLRIDNGGTFLMRAKNGRKPVDALNAITEWDKFFDSNVNGAYAKIAKAAGYETAADMKAVIVPQIEKLLAVKDANGGWAGYVEKIAAGLPAADKQKIVGMLDARSNLLSQKMAELKRPAPPAPRRLPPGMPIRPTRGYAPPPIDHELLAIRRLEDLPKRRLPEGLTAPPDGSTIQDYRARATAQLNANATAGQREAISGFTNGTYTKIRKAQTMTKEEFERENGRGTYENFKKLGEQCEAVFGKVAPCPGQVFRGIRNLPRSVIDQMMQQETFDLLGTSSTSRHSSVAHEFMGGESGSSHRVMMVIHQKTAIPIETISRVESEKELLLSRHTKLRILARHRAEENPSILIIEMEEITDAAPPAPAPRPRRRRKPAGT